MQLLKSQKNEFFDLILENNLYPSMFDIDDVEDDGDCYTNVQFNNSSYHFACNANDNGMFSIRYSPAIELVTKNTVRSSWDGLVFEFDIWLKSLRREIYTEDKWATLEKGIPDFKLAINDVGDKFSYNEFTQIEDKIKTLKGRIKSIELTVEQQNAFEQKLDQCIELAKTANKFDWAGYFIGIITTIILTLSVTPDNAKAIWEAVKQAFHQFILL